MKKISSNSLVFLLLIIFLPGLTYAFNIELYCLYGWRAVNNADIKSIYGNGQVYFPAALVDLWKGFILGVGYEGGYSRDGHIGIYEEFTNLKIEGIEAFAGYQLNLKVISIYARGGYGIYSYKQFIDNPEIPFKIDEKKGAFVVAGGLKLFPVRNLFIIAELKYVPLKVKPIEEEIDLGGLRVLGGLGLRL
ncbi:MAG: hypothetical protein KA522_00840 [Candidatus Saccharicenans sp.]|jgi:opacity protein-like surface antigen|nr:hypothetical protein [Candidatus Saccharicenans sp.]